MTGVAYPTIERLGNSRYANGSVPTTAQTIVSSGANVNGVIIRSVVMISNSAGNTLFLYVNGDTFVTQAAQVWEQKIARNILVPPGQAVTVQMVAAGTGGIVMTYDLL